MFQWRKKRWKLGVQNDDSEVSKHSDKGEDNSDDKVGRDSEKMEWGKKVEPELRKWIKAEECH
jgi:hypothetical protein